MKPNIPDTPNAPLVWTRTYGCGPAHRIAQLLQDDDLFVLLLTPDASALHRMQDELQFFCNDDIPIIIFPDSETLPYDRLSPHKNIIAEKLDALAKLRNATRGVCIASVSSAMHKLAPTRFIDDNTFILKRGGRLDSIAFQRQLSSIGYIKTSQVFSFGEYAVRGSVIDFYPPASHAPVRIDLFDDEIESLRLFSPSTQLSKGNLEQITVLPSQEYAYDSDSIQKFRTCFREEFHQKPDECPVYQEISNDIIPEGIESYMPLFFDQMESLFDYIPQQSLVIFSEDVTEHAKQHWQYIDRRRELLKDDAHWPTLPLQSLYEHPDSLASRIKALRHIEIRSFEDTPKSTPKAPTKQALNYRTLPPLALNVELQEPTLYLRNFVESFDGNILFVAHSKSYYDQLLELLRDIHLSPKQVDGWEAFRSADHKLCLSLGELSEGVILDEGAKRIAIVPESKVLGHHISRRRSRRATARNTESLIKDIDQLEVGCPVVHEKHGVGRFVGLETVEIDGNSADFCIIAYAGSDKLYVPIAALHLLSRYATTDPDNAPLHHLGKPQWDKAKRKAAQKAYDIATQLLDTQARRENLQGIAFDINEAEYHLFASSFPYEETEDQEKAIHDVLEDMRSDKPMDRVICGDVGFGKTEVALRAMFVAASSGRQVAVLAPTTLLARQHLETFQNRFADWPIKVEMLTRFHTSKNQQRIITDINEGRVDVVVGTHKLLSSKVNFQNLGLIVIDEEHRFGVRDKEKIKMRYAKSDIMMLTATPIPRTLSMSLNKLRDITLISTPPPDRYAIKTFIKQWDDALIQDSCQRELLRGGQIFFVHNRIETINEIAAKLKVLLPEARFSVAHGSMREYDLEKAVLSFYNQESDILVCTTIIENGIDIPTANTMIVNRADRFGLAQLHQLRGRIGRSHHAAYAYMLVPPKNTMTADAVRRLEAIESLEDLGIGLALAQQDLEIRGAGELLGKEQSGHITEIGFSIYSKLLKQAVEVIRSDAEFNIDKPLDTVTEIDLGEPAFIPHDYLPDINLRLILYRQIANLKDDVAIRNMADEMVDRFGESPEPLINLLRNASLRIKCHKTGINEVKRTSAGLRIAFDEEADMRTNRLIECVTSEPHKYQFVGNHSLLLRIKEEEAQDAVAKLEALIKCIGRNT